MRNSIVFPILLLIFWDIYPSEKNELNNTIYLSNETLDLSTGDSKNRYVGLIQTKMNAKYSLSLEKRGERSLGSLEIKEKYFYTSVGYRYKAVPGFYFLRDSYSYSAFQNPVSGILTQPIQKSGFLGGNIFNYGLGIFFSSTVSEKKPGIYFHGPSETFGIAYSSETNLGFLNLNFRELKLFTHPTEVSVVSQIYGTKENNYGYFNTKIFHPIHNLEFKANLYRDDSQNNLLINPDNFGVLNQKRFAVFNKLSYNFVNRIEHFSEFYPEGRESMVGGSASFLSSIFGHFCAGGRNYEKYNMIEKDYKKIYSIKALAISYEWKKNTNEFIIRYEERENKDGVYELKTTVKPSLDWRLELSLLFNKKNNELRSVYEQWSDGENINTIFTDRESALKCKIIGSFIVLNLSSSRQKNGNDIYFANIQFKYDF